MIHCALLELMPYEPSFRYACVLQHVHNVLVLVVADIAALFTLRNVFPDWQPDKVVSSLEKQSLRLARKLFK